MSVDKFGRYSEFGGKSTYFGKRDGLPLTPDGDYDISNKRLKHVNDPKDEKDAINLKHLKSETSIALKLKGDIYDANFHRITNLGKPEENTDSITKEYLISEMTKCLKLKDESYNANNMKISNVSKPDNDKDAVNLHYIKENCITHDGQRVDCKRKVLQNVGEGVNDLDCVIMTQSLTRKRGKDWDGRNVKIKNVGEGVDDLDCVVMKQALIRGKDKHESYNANNMKIINLSKPDNDKDAVNLHYIKENCITHDGQRVDCKRKVLQNVGEGVNDLDCVIMTQSLTRKRGKDWDGRNVKIKNVGEGVDDLDCVVMKQALIRGKDKHWNGKNKKLTNVAEGVQDFDCVTMSQLKPLLTHALVKEVNIENWDRKIKARVTNVDEDVNLSDVTILKQGNEKHVFLEYNSGIDCWNGLNKKIINIRSGKNPKDAVVFEQALVKDENGEFWNGRNLKLENVKKGVYKNDVAIMNQTLTQYEDKEIWWARGARIAEGAEGIDDFDFIIKKQALTQTNKKEWDGKNVRLTNMAAGVDPNDAAILKQLVIRKENAFILDGNSYRCLEFIEDIDCWDGHNKKIKYVSKGERNGEVVTFDQALVKDVGGNNWDGRKLRLVNVAEGVNGSDCVTVKQVGNLIETYIKNHLEKLIVLKQNPKKKSS